MKYYLLAIGLLFLLCSCDGLQKSLDSGDEVMGVTDGFVEGQTREQLNHLIAQIDKKRTSQAFDPIPTEESAVDICGSTVDAYYLNGELAYTTSRTEHEAKGYSTRKVFWAKGEILKIVYQVHLPDWERHQEKYPPNVYGSKLEKMVYGDTLYEVTFGEGGRFHQKSVTGKLLSNRVDQTLLLKLVECAYSVKSELIEEKEKKSRVISYTFKGLENYQDTLPFQKEYELHIDVSSVDPESLNCMVSNTPTTQNKIIKKGSGIYSLSFTKNGTYKLYLSMRNMNGSQKHIDTKILYIRRPE